MNRNEIMSVEYREEMENQLARDFWFMCMEQPDFTWTDEQYIKACFPMEFGNGWLQGFYNLCNELTTEVKSSFRFEQIKEKWGFINIYYSGGITPYGEQLIRKFEKESKDICEICGQPGKIGVYSGWYRTLCEDCIKEMEMR